MAVNLQEWQYHFQMNLVLSREMAITIIGTV